VGRGKPQVGDEIRVWWQTGRGNMATVLAVLPYTGKFPEWFDCVLRLSAPNTRRGWMEMAYRSSDYERDA
jgi:hypothetical protein